MTTTTIVSLTGGTPKKVSDGDANVLVQVPSGVVYVGVFQSQPPTKVGHVLDSSQRTASFGGLVTGDQVWAYSAVDTNIVVTK